MKYYFLAFKKYAVFSGRANRSEYWYFFLFNIIVSIVLSILGKEMGLLNISIGPTYKFDILSIIYGLITVVPGLALLVRRLHDVGKSGWIALLSLIPIIGTIWILVLATRDSVSGENKYGPNPKGVSSPNVVQGNV